MFKKTFSFMIGAFLMFSMSGYAFAEVQDFTDEEQKYIDATIEATCAFLNSDNPFNEDVEAELIAIYKEHGISESYLEVLNSKYQGDEAISLEITSGAAKCSEKFTNAILSLTPEQLNYVDAMVEGTCAVIKYEGDDVFAPELGYQLNEIMEGYGYNITNETELKAISEEFKDISGVQWSIFFEVDDCKDEVGTAENMEIFLSSAFDDVPFDHDFHHEINYLSHIGVVNGYVDGTFKPDQDINRAEFLKVLIINRGWEISDYSNCYSDVKDEWFANYVCYATEKGWVQGYDDGLFRPEQTVTKAEALKMLFEIYSDLVDTPELVSVAPFSDTPTTDWYTKYVVNAKNLGLLDTGQSEFGPADNMSRGGICNYLYDLLVWFYGEGIDV